MTGNVIYGFLLLESHEDFGVKDALSFCAEDLIARIFVTARMIRGIPRIFKNVRNSIHSNCRRSLELIGLVLRRTIYARRNSMQGQMTLLAVISNTCCRTSF
ncbi:hypothetical protein TNCV_1823491 [Trichonephila clavipes]|nr:hypothetical protein TNCV_1823491 [Trichonephila clavipes]